MSLSRLAARAGEGGVNLRHGGWRCDVGYRGSQSSARYCWSCVLRIDAIRLESSGLAKPDKSTPDGQSRHPGRSTPLHYERVLLHFTRRPQLSNVIRLSRARSAPYLTLTSLLINASCATCSVSASTSRLPSVNFYPLRF